MSGTRKFVFFFLGLIIGLIVGAVSAWFFHKPLKEVKLFSAEAEKTDSLAEALKETDSFGQPEVRRNFEFESDVSEPDSIVLDSLELDIPEGSYAAEFMTLLQTGQIDSLTFDSLMLNFNVSETGDFVVRKDELQYVRTIRAEGTSEIIKAGIDTLLVGNIQAKNIDPALFYAEFWVSPLNFKGYKRVDTRLVLYGIPDPMSVRLKLLEGELCFLQSVGKWYALNESMDFESFIEVTDLAILNELND